MQFLNYWGRIMEIMTIPGWSQHLLMVGRISYYWKENGERETARNYGAALAKGKYL